MSNLLASSPAEIVSQLIINLGHGTDSGTWPVYADFKPNSPDNLIVVHTVTESLGNKDQFGDVAEHPGVQVEIQSGSYTAGSQKARDIANALDVMSQRLVTYGGEDYVISSFLRKSPVRNPTRNLEDTNRDLFTFYGSITVRQTS